MLGHLAGLSQILLEHIFRLCSGRVPSTHEMSIMLVRPARVTDTTLEKHSVVAFLPLRRVALRYAP